ncbi:MAG: inorganic diphosphatase [Candidatus Nanoarchaeia archaeon]
MIKANEKRHPWHDISYGEDAPDEVYAVIECPKQSNLKYELEKESGFIKLDRVLYSAVHYPGDYGFIPQTLSDDNDPLDIIILSNFPVAPGVIVRARPIGVIEMVDNDEKDAKIIAVHDTDPRFDRYNNITDVSDNIIKEIRHFFQTYKQLQDKKVEILSIKNHVAAKKEIRRSIKMYEEEFLKKNVRTNQTNKVAKKTVTKRANVSAKAVPKLTKKTTKKSTKKSSTRNFAKVALSKRKRL